MLQINEKIRLKDRFLSFRDTFFVFLEVKA